MPVLRAMPQHSTPLFPEKQTENKSNPPPNNQTSISSTTYLSPSQNSLETIQLRNSTSE
jgi:hypothetical protein